MSDCRFGVSPVNYPDPDPEDNCSQDEHLSVKVTPVKTSNGALLPLRLITWSLRN